MKRYFPILYVVFLSFLGCQPSLKKNNKKPKLIVGIVIDQMRYDYLNRFASKYGNNGFHRLLREGFSLENAHYNYIPTYTAVGHASIFTGTTPVNHGIIGNNWFDKYLGKSQLENLLKSAEKTFVLYFKRISKYLATNVRYSL